MLRFLLVFLGGGVGCMLRYAVQILLHERIHPYLFPWSTLLVNIAGCFLIGMFYSMSDRMPLSQELRIMLTAGLCGGFTTFSTFGNDIALMIRTGDVMPVICYIAVSVIAGVLAVFAGGWVGRSIC